MAGGIGGFLSGIFGSENEEKAAKPAIDSNAYNYGGYEGGATDAAMRYRENARNAQGREAAQANYDAANRMNKMGLQARGDMNQVGQAQLARALGKVPSIAEMNGARQMGQVAAAQGALQASARGRGALANAATTAANNTANAQGSIAGQTQINAAGERMAAEAAASGTFAGLQAADAQRTGMAANMAQYQATNQMQQRELNDRMTSDQLKNEIAVQGMQLGASQNLQTQNSANSLGAAGINAGVGGQNASMNQANAYGVLGMAGQIAGGYAAGGGGGSVTGKAAGGPVDGGKTYVMGEYGPEAVMASAGGAGASMRDQNSFRPEQLQSIDLDEPEVQIVGQNGPEIVVPEKDGVVLPSHVTVPMLAQSTWGTGQGNREAQEIAAQDAETSTARGQQLQETAARTVSPWEKQVKDTSVLQRRGLASDEDVDSAKRSRQVLRDARGSKAVPEDKDDRGSPEEKAAVAEGKALPKRKGIASIIGDGAAKMAGGIDTAYHGPTSVAGPNLIPVAGARAGGGPVFAGLPYLMGEKGPEAVGPMAGTGNPTGLTKMSGGGMDVLGSLKAHSNFATKFQHDPSGGMVAGAREDGGPVKRGLSYVMGERGPEAVINLDDDVTMTEPKDEAAFQAWKKRYAHPQDDGEDYDLRGAFKAGLKPGPDGHWPDTFKRPNHPTFSNESKYANNEGAKPGRWDGDTFIPHRGTTPDGSAMRDGSSDARTRSFDKSFHRDTPADQKRVKRGVEDKAGKDADAMMASMRKSMQMGPSVAVRNQDGDETRIAAREEGGPVEKGKPVLVGEKGPEAVSAISDNLRGTAQNIFMGPAGNAQKMANEAAWAIKREQNNPKPGDGEAFKQAAAAVGKSALGPLAPHFLAKPPATVEPEDPAKKKPPVVPMSAFLTRLFGGR
jgi:hypothetical protein